MKDSMALCWAGYQGDLEEIQRLVANGINLNAKDYDGRTCLHLAASEGNEKVVKFLIAKKVDLNPKDLWGHTPLDDAKRHNFPNIVQQLQKASQKK